jgi:hypothetical protein
VYLRAKAEDLDGPDERQRAELIGERLGALDVAGERLRSARGAVTR